MKVRVLKKLDEIKEISGDWDDLLGRCGIVPLYLSSTWIYNWFRFIGKECKPLIITGSIEDRLVFVLPLLLRNFLIPFFKILHFPGYPGSDHLGLIVDPGYKEEANKRVFTFLEEYKSKWDVCNLAEIPEIIFNDLFLSGPNIHVSFKKFKVMDGPQCPYLRIDGNWEEFYRKRKKRKFRYNLDRARRRLEGLGTIEFKTLKTWEEIEHYTPQIFEIHRKRWEGYYIGSKFSTPSGEEFYRRMAKEYQTRRWLDIAVLLLNGQVIAYSYSFIWGGEYFYYNPAHDPKFSEFSPGTLLLIYILERSFNSGLKRFDFGRGELSYKSHWADGTRQNKILILANTHLKGRVCFWLYLMFLYLRNHVRRSIFIRTFLAKFVFFNRK